MKNEITISTEEYKELVSKTIPNNSGNEFFKTKLEEFLIDHLKIEDTKLNVKSDWRFGEDFEKWLRIIDKEMYKRIYNALYDEKIKKENDKMKMEKARANKEINNEEEA